MHLVQPDYPALGMPTGEHRLPPCFHDCAERLRFQCLLTVSRLRQVPVSVVGGDGARSSDALSAFSILTACFSRTLTINCGHYSNRSVQLRLDAVRESVLESDIEE